MCNMVGDPKPCRKNTFEFRLLTEEHDIDLQTGKIFNKKSCGIRDFLIFPFKMSGNFNNLKSKPDLWMYCKDYIKPGIFTFIPIICCWHTLTVRIKQVPVLDTENSIDPFAFDIDKNRKILSQALKSTWLSLL